MAATLKVLMMGGRSCGKTSLLAGLLNDLLHGAIKSHLSASDITDTADGQRSLEELIQEAKKMLVEKCGKTVLQQGQSTNSINTYTIRLYIPQTPNKHLEIEFIDVNGEYYQSGNTRMQEVQELIRRADVCLIAIDTVFMMEAVNPDNHLCRPTINDRFNLISDMHSFLSQIANEQGEKLVLFVPMKCEKWVAEGRTNEIMQQVEKLYATSIYHLKQAGTVTIGILPVQTLGGIHFTEHREPMICSYTRWLGLFRSTSPCAVLDECNPPQLRFPDGTVRNIKSSDRIQEDGRALFGTTTVPSSWFTIHEKGYKPVCCDQVVLQTLLFVTQKVINRCNRMAQNESWLRRTIQQLLEGLADITASILRFVGMRSLAEELSKFGSIPVRQMEQMLQDLKQKRVLKQTDKYIKFI